LGVKKDFIGKLRKELDLEPIGYVVITDSIVSYLKMQEGTPTTSILIQVSRDELTLNLVRLGRTEATEIIGRSDDIVEDVTEGVSRFKIIDNLPSRIILFINSMHNLDEIIQNLLSTDWPSQFNFLHIPKIEALAKDVAIRALVVAGGSEVAKSLGLVISSVPSMSDDEGDIQTVESKAVEPTPKNDESLLISAQEIGFSESSPGDEKIDFIDPDDEPSVSVPSLPILAKASDRNFAIKLPKLKLPRIHLPKFKLNLAVTKPHWWILGVGLVIIGILVFWLIWFLPSAKVIIRVLPKDIDEEVELTLSASESSINFQDRILPATIESVTESGEEMMNTTGKKIVGDPAKGLVTIYNRTSAAKTFAKGTTIASGSLKFTLDQDVQVASKSAGSDYVDVPGKANVEITALTIGSDSNLPGGTEFSILSFGKDSYVGKNDESLKGGTSEEVQVVGKDDQKTLVSNLTTKLLEQLTIKLSQDNIPGKNVYLVPSSVLVDTVAYSAKVGESVKTLTANLTIKASILRYQAEDITNLVNSSIDEAVPEGYVRSTLPSQVELTVDNVDESGESVRGNAKVKVGLLPVVNLKKLENLIKGKNGVVLENILKQYVPGYSTAEIRVTPSWIPLRLKSMPQNPSRISIDIMPSI
jgi:hypothetical protein